MSTTLVERITSAPITFDVTEATIAEARSRYMALRINGIEDKEGFEAVHAARMEVKKTRIAVEKRHKELKADALEYGRKCDEAKRHLIGLLDPIETHLQAEEDRIAAEKERIKREAAAKKQAIFDARVKAIMATGFCPASPSEFHPDRMTDAEFEANLADAKEKARIEAERKAAELAEQKRREAEEAEKRRIEESAAAERRRAEEERLAAERAEYERKRAEQEARLKAERAELDRMRREQAAEAERVAQEKARLEAIERQKAREAEHERAKAEDAKAGTAWRPGEFMASDVERAADAVLCAMDDYSPANRKAFLNAVISRLMQARSELAKNEAA